MTSLNRRIKDWLGAGIAEGTWPTGAQIPSEAALARQFGASRMTVNRAVRELSEAGRLLRIRGSGTYVAPPRTQAPLFEIRSIRAEIEAAGGTHSCRVLDLVRLRPDPGLGLHGTTAIRLVALHAADGRPVQLERRHVDAELAPGFAAQDFSRVTASDYLLAAVPYAEVEHTVAAVAAGAAAKLLGVVPAAPCLRLTRRTFTAAGRVITHVELLHPGDGFALTGRFAGRTALA